VILDYRDRELADAPPDAVRRSLVSLIRRVRPSIVATFDPNGFNVHPDHVAIADSPRRGSRLPPIHVGIPDAGEAHLVPRLVWTPPIAAWEVGKNRSPDEHGGVDFVLDVLALARPQDRRASRAPERTRRWTAVLQRARSGSDPRRGSVATGVGPATRSPPLAGFDGRTCGTTVKLEVRS
jgi:LmbE family N-acetylglucosaminyl deacetylase